MKNPKLLMPYLLLVLGLHSCHDKYTETYLANVPVYISLEEWRSNDIEAMPARSIEHAGKIYIYLDYLLIVDRGLGVHIVNNAVPSAPMPVAFLPIYGCVDVAVRNNVLYVDSHADLLSFDLRSPEQPLFLCRMEDALDVVHIPEVAGFDHDLPVAGLNPEGGIIIKWTQQRVSVEMDHPNSSWDGWLPFNSQQEFTTTHGSNAPGSSGIGGSMAQFTLSGNFLYVLRPSSITTFRLDGDHCPESSSVVSVSWDAETIFPYDNHLFLGTRSGMMIYNLNNPAQPEFVSSISHLTACDPVVVQDNRAYVTIRSGTTCMGVLNQLLVIDVSDYSAPYTIAEYDLFNPHGLGIDGNTLFICDGSDGLKVFDAENDMSISDHLIAHYQNIRAYDVIPYNNLLLMSAEEGIYQYDYSDSEHMVELSVLPTNP